MTTLIGHSSKNGSGAHSLAAYADHEVLAAERMKWWGVFLLREKRRLQGIAEAVHSSIEVGAASTPPPPDGSVARQSIESLLDEIDGDHGIHIGESW